MLATQDHHRKVIGTTQVDSQANLNIIGMDIPTPPVDTAVEMQQLEQLTHQGLDRLMNYMEEQIDCTESLVQCKMLADPREGDSTLPAINHTQVVLGFNSVMGQKSSKTQRI